jgi:hypothetical protein
LTVTRGYEPPVDQELARRLAEAKRLDALLEKSHRVAEASSIGSAERDQFKELQVASHRAWVEFMEYAQQLKSLTDDLRGPLADEDGGSSIG